MIKNSFVLYTDYAEQLELLSDEQCGVLFRAIMAHETGEQVPAMDGITKMAFSVISQRLRRDREAYERKCESNRGNALKRWDANAYSRNANYANAQNAQARIKSHSDNDNDNDPDSDIKRARAKRKKASFKYEDQREFSPELETELIEMGFK